MFMFMLPRDEPASAAEDTQRNAGRRRLSSKVAANRVKDRESLPRLRAFREYLLRRRASPNL